MTEMVRCRQCGAAFPYEPVRRARTSPGPAMLEFEARRRELRLKEHEAGQTHGAPDQIARRATHGVSLAQTHESPGTSTFAETGVSRYQSSLAGIPKNDGSLLEDIARSLADRAPIEPAPPREEGIALEPNPKAAFDRKAYHRQYMRGWRREQALRRSDGPA